MWKLALLIVSLVNFAVEPSCCEIDKHVKLQLGDIRNRLRRIMSDIFLIQLDDIWNNATKDVDCADLYNSGLTTSGVYTVSPLNRVMMNRSMLVYCDMDTDGGGWTVIQRRGKFGKHDWYFHKDWNEYKIGFGDVEKDFWLGNDKIFALTNQKSYSLRIDLQDQKKNRAYAKYKQFWIDDENNKYTLHIHNFSGGNAGDAMSFHNNMKFSTRDKDNDLNTAGNCAAKYSSAWWYRSCYKVDLNGVYDHPSHGIQYRSWKYQPLYWTEMKIKPYS